MGSFESVVESAGTGPLEAEVFGSPVASVVSASLESLTIDATDRSVRGGRWYRSSVAAVAGVELEDGTEVVVRAYRPSTGREFVDGVVRVQSHLAKAGFPCPAPVGVPVVADGILGRVESLLPDPGPRRFDPWEMELSARGLAEVVRLTAGVDPLGLGSNPMALPDGRLYPPPHSPVFDFDGTAAGAGWIDAVAGEAREAMTDRDDVIAHGDWTARNIRLAPSGVVCAYDWESLSWWPEPSAAGVAAATWNAVGEPDEPAAPSGQEIDRYLDLYESARGRPFAHHQRRSALASAVYALAYTARCEHALDPGTRVGRASRRLTQEGGLLELLR